MNSNAYLVIDIGNTAQKVAVFDEAGNQLSWLRQPVVGVADLEAVLQEYRVKAALVSSGGETPAALEEFLQQRVCTLKFSPQLQLPVRLAYATPKTLGTDRIACAVGAHALYPMDNVLAIQAGSCLVTDLVTAEGDYLGGTIAPGLCMRLRALEHFTARLPLLEPSPVDFLVGDTTEKSILSGVVNGLVGEIEGMVYRYQAQFSPLKVVLTGGDAPLLSNSLKNSIFAAPNLVLLGLYKILRFNV